MDNYQVANKSSLKLIFFFVFSGIVLIIISGLIGYFLGKKQIKTEIVTSLSCNMFCNISDSPRECEKGLTCLGVIEEQSNKDLGQGKGMNVRCRNPQCSDSINCICESLISIPSVSPTSTRTVSTDEVLGIQINTCCSCPTKINKSLIGTDGWINYEMGKNYSNLLPKYCKGVNCAPCPLQTDDNTITFDQLKKGWYWGYSNQKLSETPSDWIYQEAGRSSCWHKPEIDCL